MALEMSAAAGNQIFEEVGWAGTAFQYCHSLSPQKERGTGSAFAGELV